MEKISFTNISKESFSHTWDGRQFEFLAGESYMLEQHLARHFAKHLADREMNRLGKFDPVTRDNLLGEMLGNVVVRPIAEPASEEKSADVAEVKPKGKKKKADINPEFQE